MLRSDPANETGSRIWAQSTGILFGRLVARHGVVVLNDPDGLDPKDKTLKRVVPDFIRLC